MCLPPAPVGHNIVVDPEDWVEIPKTSFEGRVVELQACEMASAKWAMGVRFRAEADVRTSYWKELSMKIQIASDQYLRRSQQPWRIPLDPSWSSKDTVTRTTVRRFWVRPTEVSPPTTRVLWTVFHACMEEAEREDRGTPPPYYIPPDGVLRTDCGDRHPSQYTCRLCDNIEWGLPMQDRTEEWLPRDVKSSWRKN